MTSTQARVLASDRSHSIPQPPPRRHDAFDLNRFFLEDPSPLAKPDIFDAEPVSHLRFLCTPST